MDGLIDPFGDVKFGSKFLKLSKRGRKDDKNEQSLSANQT